MFARMIRRRHGRSELDRPTSRWLFAGSTVRESAAPKCRARSCHERGARASKWRLYAFRTHTLKTRPPPQPLLPRLLLQIPRLSGGVQTLIYAPDEFHPSTTARYHQGTKTCAAFRNARDVVSRTCAPQGVTGYRQHTHGSRARVRGFHRMAWPGHSLRTLTHPQSVACGHSQYGRGRR